METTTEIFQVFFAKGVWYDKKGLKIAIEEKDRRGEMLANGNLGTAYHSLADFEKAKKFHDEQVMIAQELGDRREEGRAYTKLGNVYRTLKDFDQAKLLHMKGLKIAQEEKDKVGKADALYSLGRDSESVGSLLEALKHHKSCVKLYNRVRTSLRSEDRWKICFRDQHKDAYIALWETLVKLKRTDEALCEAEKGRAQDLNDLLKLHFGYKESRKYEEMPHIVRNISTQTVFIALGSNKINFWVFRKGKEICFRQKELDAAAAIQHLNKNVCTAIEAHDSDVPRVTSLSILYDTVIGPIEDLLEGDELMIIPDGPLHFVPYAALLNHEEPEKYLSEYYRIRILPSLTSLKIIKDSADHHGKLTALLVGNPTESLPCTEKEVDTISTIISRPNDVQVLKNQEATKEALLNSINSVALVHIAAHGQTNTGEIVLARKNSKDGDNVLKMQDVQERGLTARLVVLSCCNTSRGNISAEGVVGIARAFLCAGARSVVASLWKIDDCLTMKFMTRFYQCLVVHGEMASMALQHSMKYLRDSLKDDGEKKGKGPAEKYWAPFVLIGDDVTLKFGKSE